MTARYDSIMSDTRLTQLEETTAHLSRVTEELSEVIARQDAEIRRLTRLVELLTKREADRDAQGTGGVILGDERPPHY